MRNGSYCIIWLTHGVAYITILQQRPRALRDDFQFDLQSPDVGGRVACVVNSTPPLAVQGHVRWRAT